MAWQFTPDAPKSNTLQVPFLEDARADFAPYYASSKTLDEAQAQVVSELGKLGAGVTSFIPGYFTVGGQQRHGYIIEFVQGGVRGVVRVAGLPIRDGKTEKTIAQVRVQALLNVADWIKSAVTARIFSPDANPLLPYLLVDGKHTVAEAYEQRMLLAAPTDPNVVDVPVEEVRR